MLVFKSPKDFWVLKSSNIDILNKLQEQMQKVGYIDTAFMYL